MRCAFHQGTPSGPTTRSPRVRSSLLVPLLAILALATSVQGQARADSAARARRHHQEGVSFFQAGRLREALEAFKAGYALSSRPEFLLNLAQCHRALGQPKEAISHLETFLRKAPAHPLRRAVEQTLAQLRQATGSSEGESAPPAKPGPSERAPVEPAPSRQPVVKTPTAPRLAQPSPTPLTHPPVAPAPPRRRSTAWKWIVGFGGAVLVVGAGVTAVYFGTRGNPPASLGTLHLPRP
ncbi:MAG: tetratricopeptide repeat protein [Deltaproteobacteria bacterium]|nr:tetratricopeptide repeat protein [Deltaproteobacteria bacterium]